MMEVRQDPMNKQTWLRLDNLESATKRGIRAGWFSFAKDLQDSANREILRKPKSGRVYMIRTRGGRRRHVASAPGETHANMSGTLRKSMGWKVRGAKTMEFGYGVTSKQAPPYAEAVEEGTRRMAARPSLGIAVRKNLRNAEKHFVNGILKRVEG